MRVLLVTSRYPMPAWRGNQVRTVEWLAALGDHDLMLCCPGPASRAAAPVDVETAFFGQSPVGRGFGLVCAAFTGRPLQEGLYRTKGARRTVRSVLHDWHPEVVVVQMLRCGWAADVVVAERPSTPIVFDAIDSMGLHFDRASRNALQPLAALYMSESVRCDRRERELAGAASASVAVSDRDLDRISVTDGRGRVIPVAGRDVVSPPLSGRDQVVVLTGNLGYRPTVRGAMWFAREVWPRVRSVVPAAKWILSGARPAADIRRLERQPGVEVHADVPDLARFLACARLAIAPMSSGSGVPMKVLEAMAAGVPAVLHPWAADGLVAEGRNAVVVGRDADEWVDAVTRLLTDDDAAQRLAERGREVWQRFYHPDRVAEQIRAVVRDAVASTSW